MNDKSVLEMVNKMIVEAEGKLFDAIRKNADQNNIREIKRLIIYLKERQKGIVNNTEKTDSTPTKQKE